MTKCQKNIDETAFSDLLLFEQDDKRCFFIIKMTN